MPRGVYERKKKAAQTDSGIVFDTWLMIANRLLLKEQLYHEDQAEKLSDMRERSDKTEIYKWLVDNGVINFNDLSIDGSNYVQRSTKQRRTGKKRAKKQASKGD